MASGPNSYHIPIICVHIIFVEDEVGVVTIYDFKMLFYFHYLFWGGGHIIITKYVIGDQGNLAYVRKHRRFLILFLDRKVHT